MLDDLKIIHERDAQDALGIAEKQGQALLLDFQIENAPIDVSVDNVVYAGMGGSALGASIINSWPGLNLPFEIVRNYDLPKYVGPKTLVIVSSYSGNTEETLSALAQAEAANAQIAVLASGGRLVEEAHAKSLPLIILPKSGQPRFAVFASLKASLVVLAAYGVVEQDVIKELAPVADFIKKTTAGLRADVPTAKNPAKQLAQELIGKSVVVYGGPKTYPAAYKWKISFNENAKQVAWVNQLPEFNHNEFIGWSKQPVDKPYAVIDLRSDQEHPQVQKRFEVTARLLSGMRPEPHVVQAQGSNLLEQLLWLIVFGDFVSLYTAILNGLNPSPVDLVEKFKHELAKS